MRYLIIDTDNYEASGIEIFFFSGGEPHAKVPESCLDYTDIIFKAHLRCWNDIAKLLVVARAFWVDEDKEDDSTPDIRLHLVAGYFPGARQDRNPITDGIMTPHTLHMYADLFNLHFNKIYCFDIHSEAGSEIVNTYGFSALDMSVFPNDYAGLIQPDAGALHRTNDFAHWYNTYYSRNVPIVAFEKKRDFNTGHITSYEQVNPFPGPGRYLVVDDICDGGRTFNTLADCVQPGVILDLYVSHGIFSQGIQYISPRYHKIYTTDTFYQSNGWHVETTPAELADNLERRVVIPVMDQMIATLVEDLEAPYPEKVVTQ